MNVGEFYFDEESCNRHLHRTTTVQGGAMQFGKWRVSERSQGRNQGSGQLLDDLVVDREDGRTIGYTE